MTTLSRYIAAIDDGIVPSRILGHRMFSLIFLTISALKAARATA